MEKRSTNRDIEIFVLKRMLERIWNPPLTLLQQTWIAWIWLCRVDNDADWSFPTEIIPLLHNHLWMSSWTCHWRSHQGELLMNDLSVLKWSEESDRACRQEEETGEPTLARPDCQTAGGNRKNLLISLVSDAALLINTIKKLCDKETQCQTENRVQPNSRLEIQSLGSVTSSSLELWGPHCRTAAGNEDARLAMQNYMRSFALNYPTSPGSVYQYDRLPSCLTQTNNQSLL